MFQSITFVDQKVDYKKYVYNFEYSLLDTDFTAKLNLTIPIDTYDTREEASAIPGAFITAYADRNDVPRNLALFYALSSRHLQQTKRHMEIDRIWTDTNFPQFEYGTKYYNCMVNQFDKIHFTRGIIYA
jgi:hypothetical protein